MTRPKPWMRPIRALVLCAGFVAMVATSPRPTDWETNSPAIGHGARTLDPYHPKTQALVGFQVRPTDTTRMRGGDQAISCILKLRARLHWQVPASDETPKNVPPSVVRLRVGPYHADPNTAREQASWIETQQLVEPLRPGATVEPTVQILWNLRYGCPVGKPCQETLFVEAEWLHATHGKLVVEWEFDATLSGVGTKNSPPFEIVQVPAAPAPAPPLSAPLSAPNPVPLQPQPNPPVQSQANPTLPSRRSP